MEEAQFNSDPTAEWKRIIHMDAFTRLGVLDDVPPDIYTHRPQREVVY